MSYMNVHDVLVLKDILEKIKLDHKYYTEACLLDDLIRKHEKARLAANGKTAALIAEKRKQDPTYGRTASEKEQILNRKKQPPKKTCSFIVVGIKGLNKTEKELGSFPTKADARQFLYRNPDITKGYDIKIRKSFTKVEEK